MVLRFLATSALALTFLFAGCATPPPVWKASDIANRPQTNIRLHHNEETVAIVATSTIRKLVEIKERIEASVGVGYAELLIAKGNEPNAFAGTDAKFGRVVAITIGMLQMVKTDWDGYAAIIGHEYAHLALNHGAIRKEREAARQGIATVLGVALSAAGVPMANTISDVGTRTVTTVYSREEEREADRRGFDYMVQAGFDPQGAVRVWEKMHATTGGSLIPFLSTHPMSSERIDNMRRFIVARQATQVAISVPQFKKPSDTEDRRREQHLPGAAVAEQAQATLTTKPGKQITPPETTSNDLSSAQQAVVKSPKNPRVWQKLGQLYEGAGETENAIRAYQQSIELKPNDPATLETLGGLYVLNSQNDKAREIWERLSAVDPPRAERFFASHFMPK